MESRYTREPAGRGIVLPLLLIGAGTTLLLINLDYLSWEAVRGWLRFWPVVFILMGIEALWTRRVPWGAVSLALLISLALGASQWTSRAPAQAGSQPVSNVPGSQSLDGASRASVKLSTGGSQVQVSGMGEPGLLARWSHTGAGVQPKYRVRDGVGRLELDLARGLDLAQFWRAGPENARWSSETRVELSNVVPLDLEARIGASEAVLDLRDVPLTRLNVDAGATNATIYFPALPSALTAVIRGGASNVTLIIPDGVKAQVSSEGGLSSVTARPERFRTSADGRTISTLSDDGSGRSLQLNLRIGASNVELR